MIKQLKFIMNQKEKRQLPFLLVEIVIGALLETIGVSAILPVINILIEPESINGDGYIAKIYRIGEFEDLRSFETTLFIVIIVFYVLKNIYLTAMRFHQNYFINVGQRTLTNRLMNGYFRQSYSYFTKKNIADLQRNVSSDVGKCYQTVFAMLTIVTQGFVAIALLLFLLISDWVTTVLMMGMVGVVMLTFLKITNKLNYRYGTISRREGEQVIQWINQSFGGIKEVKLFGRERFFLKKIDKSYGESSIAECKVNVISTLPSAIMETICIVAIMVTIIIKMYTGGDMANLISVLAAFALAAIRLIPVMGNLSSSIGRVTFCKSSIDGICRELKELEGKCIEGSKQLEGKEDITFKQMLSVKQVSFHYEDNEKEILSNVNLNIKRGTSIAFIGPSGAGKTTMADLILGILHPTSGVIEVDGKNIEDNIKGWYKQIGYIPQTIYLMDDSIRNNIAFGLKEDEIDDDKVWKALEKAQLDEFVKGLPEGIDTNLGDRGVRCSGGQRQRLGIARALYNDPEFLILDEATSALDNETEKAIMEAIDGLKGKKTLLIIAHRLSTTKNCDQIYKIQNQKIMQV
jgi:ABC-type multidrug transport system fused ATPase/permease subunit